MLIYLLGKVKDILALRLSVKREVALTSLHTGFIGKICCGNETNSLKAVRIETKTQNENV